MTWVYPLPPLPRTPIPAKGSDRYPTVRRSTARLPWAANSPVALAATDGASADDPDQPPAPARTRPHDAAAADQADGLRRHLVDRSGSGPPECTSTVAEPTRGPGRRASRSAPIGAERVHADPLRRLGVTRHGRPRRSRPCGGVHAVARDGPEPGERRGVDDVAAGVAERRDRRAHPPQRAEQVHLDQAAYRLLRQFRQRPVVPDAGVVEPRGEYAVPPGRVAATRCAWRGRGRRAPAPRPRRSRPPCGPRPRRRRR